MIGGIDETSAPYEARYAPRSYPTALDLLGNAAVKAGAQVWAYCLIPNHVHAIVVPEDGHGPHRAFGDLRRRDTAHINARDRWTGHLRRARFGSVAMDENHLIANVRYIALNPVRALLVRGRKIISARAHRAGRDDCAVTPVLERLGRFDTFLGESFCDDPGYALIARSPAIRREACCVCQATNGPLRQ
jgi:putative transposase